MRLAGAWGILEAVASSVQAVAGIRAGDRRGSPVASRVLVGWHLLSLDAPSVAAVWTWFVARCARVELPWTAIAAMFCAVWVLYAADRLVDARDLARGGEVSGLEERHLFHFAHRRVFRWGIGAGCVALAALLPTMIVAEVRLYLTLGALLAGWFVVIHSGRKPLPKEFVVGVFFAPAVFTPTVARSPDMRGELLLPAVLLGALCSLNCLFIFAWEHEGSADSEAPPSTRVAAEWAVWIGCGLALASLAATGWLGAGIRGVLLAVASSAVLLVMLNGVRRRLGRTTLRALADFVLLTPVVVAGLMK
jgi:hypothetical protein